MIEEGFAGFKIQGPEQPVDAIAGSDSIYDLVRVDALKSYREFVRKLGGDPERLLEKASIDVAALDMDNGLISYRSFVHLLELSATELRCPDLGLRLARCQGGLEVLGPLEFAMMNSRSFEEAYNYCAGHLQAYSPAVQIELGPPQREGLRFIRFNIRLHRLPFQQQAVEHAMALMHHAIVAISHGEIRPCEIWFSQQANSPLSVYSRYFGATVHFGKPVNAIFLRSEAFNLPIQGRDPRLFQLATSYIESRYPSIEAVLSFQVRTVAARLLSTGKCTHDGVADSLGIHTRTLQRRLREEGVSFAEIKDELRRDLALDYLARKSLSLTKVAMMLGYSEPSVLTRSCYRWFSGPPRRIREMLVGSGRKTGAGAKRGAGSGVLQGHL